MKSLIVTALFLAAPVFVLAQTSSQSADKAEPKKAAAKAEPKKAAAKTDAKKTAAKPAAKPATRSNAKAAESKKTVVAKASPPSSRTQLKSAASQVASGFIAAEAAMTPDELAIAERVHVGRMPCELGAFVTVAAEPAQPGLFHVSGKGFKYEMTPVATTTGTVRLEDRKAGAVWLQIANKSMLMNQKLGQRMADECMSPEQTVVAEAIKKNPAVSVLEPLK